MISTSPSDDGDSESDDDSDSGSEDDGNSSFKFESSSKFAIVCNCCIGVVCVDCFCCFRIINAVAPRSLNSNVAFNNFCSSLPYFAK